MKNMYGNFIITSIVRPTISAAVNCVFIISARQLPTIEECLPFTDNSVRQPLLGAIKKCITYNDTQINLISVIRIMFSSK